MKKQLNNPALESLKNLVKESGSQIEAATRLKITPQYLSDILKGRRGVSTRVASKLGLKKTVIYEDK